MGESSQAPGVPDSDPPRVYLVHRKDDDELARSIAKDLRRSGIDCWYDGWEILGGDNFVTQMETGLQKAHGGLILLTPSGIGNGSWSYEEFTVLMRRVVDEREREPRPFLIPVVEGDCPDMPEFLRNRRPLPAGEREELARHILRHTGHLDPAAPPLGELRPPPAPLRLALELTYDGEQLVATFEGERSEAALPEATLEELRCALRPGGVLRDDAARVGRAGERLQQVGRRLGALLGDGELAGKIQARLEPKGREAEVELALRCDDARVLSLPWEAARIGALQPLGILPRVALTREAGAASADEPGEVPGPLKVLAAIAAPAHDLDQDRETQVLLDSLEGLQHVGTRVVFADESSGTLDALREHLDQEPFHVLHLSCHGGAGTLQLEDADAGPAEVAAERFAQVLTEAEHTPLLVVLSACHSGAAGDEAAGVRPAFARALLDAGIPAVVAMQGPVGDGYATELAGELYRALARDAEPVPAVALARARGSVEQQRLRHAERGRAFRATEPEYGTPGIWTRPGLGLAALYDGTRPGTPHPAPAPLVKLPGLALRPFGYFVGRRALRRELRRNVVPAGKPGAVLWGMGGIGKSSLACSLAVRLRREGWLVAVVVGELALSSLTEAIVRAHTEQSRGVLSLSETGASRIETLSATPDDAVQVAELRALLAEERVLLVLDNFESNFVTDTGLAGHRLPAGLARPKERLRVDSALARLLPELASAAHVGALLVTSRYRVSELEAFLEHLRELGPLRPVELQRFLWRLPGLHGLEAAERSAVVTELGGHPRVLEFADALLRDEPAEPGTPLLEVRGRIRELAESGELELPEEEGSLEERTGLARHLAAEDVLLDELLGRLDAEERRFVVAASVFRRAVPLEPLAAVARAVGLDWDEARVRRALRRLERLTLVVPMGPMVRPGAEVESHRETWMVHRWTASTLAEREPVQTAAHRVAGDWWWAPESISIDDAWEALEHALVGGDLERAQERAGSMYSWLLGVGRALDALALAERMAAGFGEDDPRRFAWWGDSVDELLALGRTGDAHQRARETRSFLEAAGASAAGASVELQRALSVSYNKLADLHRALGNGPEARRLYEQGLDIRKRLAEREPDRADFQRDLTVSLERLADLHLALGNGPEARRLYEQGLDIRKRLAEREPDRADFQRDLSVSYNKLADLHRALGNGPEARRLYEQGLEIAQRLAEREPDRADFQRDLTVSLERLADLHLALGNGPEARRLYEQGLEIAQRLAEREPDRADFQRDLTVSLERLADLHLALGNGPEARRLYEQGLDIRKRLAEREPDRADFQRDLSVSYNRLADLHLALGNGPEARRLYEQGLEIAQRLAEREPDRADFQRDLSVSYIKLADLHRALGNGPEARRLYEQGLEIAQRLAEREPDRADFQRDLAVSYERMGRITEGDESLGWIDRAIEIRRKVIELDPQQVVPHRELGIALFQMAQAAEDVAALTEAATILVGLLRQDVLEAQFVPLAQQLEAMLGEDAEEAEPEE